jgi:hypothetical protein
MGKTQFSGPVRTGKVTGVPATDTTGTLIAEQMTTVVSDTSGASSIVLPANSKIQDIVLTVSVSASGNAQGMLVRVGNADDVDYFASLKASAAGVYRLGVAPNVAAGSAASLNNVGASAVRLYVDVTAASSATNVENFAGFLSVTYVQR